MLPFHITRKVAKRHKKRCKAICFVVKCVAISLDHEISFCLKNGLVLTEKEGGSEDAVAYTNRV